MEDPNEKVLDAIATAIHLAFELNKKAGNEGNGGLARVYAITVSELEKAYAYLSTYGHAYD